MIIQIALLLMMFMSAVDTSILATITPQIIASVGDMHLYPLLSSAFLFGYVIATPLFGLVADHYGCKRSGYISLLLFALGSFLSGISVTMTQLIVFRFIQGFGSGGLVNTCFVLIGRLFHTDKKRSLMMACLSAVWATASILGPLLGTYLTIEMGWRAVFFINIPLAAIASLLLYFYSEGHEKLQDRFDIKGLILFILGCTATFCSVNIFASHGFSFITSLFFILGSAILCWFCMYSWSAHSPLIPISLLKNPVIASCIIFGVISGACLTTAGSLISLYIQGALRESIRSAGFVIASMSIGWTVGSFFCGILLHKLLLRMVTAISLAALMTGFIFLGLSDKAVSIYYFIGATFTVGFGMGACVNSSITGMQRASHSKLLGRATSFLSLMRSFGMSIGASFSGFMQLSVFREGLLSTSTLPAGLTEKLICSPEILLEPHFASTVSISDFDSVTTLFGNSIETVFWVPVIIIFISFPCVFLIPNKTSNG